MALRIKKLYDDSVIPERGSEFAAGMDLCAHIDCDVVIQPHSTVKIGTGISAAIPCGSFGAVFARSGLATKSGLRPANAVGVIDPDYRGEIIVALHNDSDYDRKVFNGERIAQLVIIPYYADEIAVVDDLDETERGDGGFGSTGYNPLIERTIVDYPSGTVFSQTYSELQDGQLSFFDKGYE